MCVKGLDGEPGENGTEGQKGEIGPSGPNVSCKFTIMFYIKCYCVCPGQAR